MATTVETLDKGLWTGLPRASMPPGALSKAKNCRYDVGSPVLRQAEGRLRLGGLVAAPVTSLAALRWDPGTRESEAVSGLNQILYWDGSAWKLRDVWDDPTDGGWQSARTLLDANGATFTVPPTTPIEVAQINSSFVLATGGPPQIIERNALVDGPKTGTTYQYARKLGMAEMGDSSIAASNYKPRLATSATGTTYFPKGYIHFWFTWYDSVNDVEGALFSDTALTYQIFVTDTTITDIQIGINKYVIDNALYPSNADSIRVYRSLTLEGERASGGSGTDAPTQIGWPIGFRIREVTIATIAATTPALLGGVQSYTVTNYGPNSADADDISEDYVTSLPDYGGGWVDTGVGIQVPYSLNGAPPNFSTCTVFEECLVTNDLKKRNRIRWSNPSDPDHFGTYAYMDFDTDDQDEVIKVLTLGNVLMVYLRNSVWRIEYLPTPNDPVFSRGRVRDLIDPTKGAVNPRSVCHFTLPGQGPMHAFVHSTGVYATNGDVTIPLLNHVNWEYVSSPQASLASASWLVNNPEMQRLEFFTGSAAWYIQYDAAHLETRGGEIVPAVTGPMVRDGGVTAAIALVTSNGYTRVVTAANDRGLYYEGFGTTDAASTTPTYMEAQTRDLYLNKPLNEFLLQKVLTRIVLGGPGDKLTLAGWAGDANGEEFVFIENLGLASSQHVVSTEYILADYIHLVYYGPENGASHGIEFIAIGWKDLGETETD